MTQNYSPNVEQKILDKSFSVKSTAPGGGGFVMGAQWGAVNKINQVVGKGELVDKYGIPVVGINQVSWLAIAEHLDGYGLGSCNVVRAAIDDSTSKNSFLALTYGASTHAWRNGATQIRRLNDDASEPSIPMIDLTLTALTSNCSGTFVAGETITQATSGATGYVGSVRTSGSNTILDVYGVVGTFDTTHTVTGAGGATMAVAITVGQTSAIVDVLAVYGRYPGSRANSFKFAITDFDNFGTAVYAPSLNISELFAETPKSIGTVVVGSATGFSAGNNVKGVTSGAYGVIDSIDGLNVTVKELYGKFTGSEIFVPKFTYTTGSGTKDIAVGDVVYLATGYAGGGTAERCYRAVVAQTALNLGTEDYSSTAQWTIITGSTTVSSFTQTVDEVAYVVTENDEVIDQAIVSILSGALGYGGTPKFIDDYVEKYSDKIWTKAKVTGTVASTATIADFTGTISGTLLSGGASTQPTYAALQGAYDILIDDKKYGTAEVGDCHDFSDYATNFTSLILYIQSKVNNDYNKAFTFTLPKDGINASSFDIQDAKDYTDIMTAWMCIPYDNWKEVYDIYNKKKVFIPCTGDNMGVHLRTIQNYGAWEAPFGLEKGIMSNTGRLYHNLKQGKGSPVSELAKIGINSNLYKDGTGYVLWGNYTCYDPASDLSKINTAMLLLKIMNETTPLLERFISKNINEKTFENIRNTIDRGYLEVLKNDGAFDTLDGDNGYKFVCDTSNNTSATRNKREIICYFFVKPPKAAEFIKMTSIITPAGVSFTEVV